MDIGKSSNCLIFVLPLVSTDAMCFLSSKATSSGDGVGLLAACISDDITDRRVVLSGLLITDITLTRGDVCGAPEESTLMVTILGCSAEDIVN